jgi:thioredoxin 1
MTAHNISDDTFANETKSGYVLVDFWAEWCGPCRQLSPIVDEVAGEMHGKLKVCKMNVDENPETPSKYGIRGIPALILFKDGKQIASKVGSMPKTTLAAWLHEEIA